MNNFNIVLTDPILNITNNSLLNLPTPYSISFLWNIGFLIGITLLLQIITGLVISINYVAETSIAFESVIHIIRDIDSGWIINYIHINGASLFFIFIYVHIARGMYFNSPNNLPIVWASGLILLLCTIGAAFMGYVLPWGQISFWGATVITSMITAIPYVGNEITQWLWGNFSVSQPTLNRFFSLHFLIPILISALALIHLILLHEEGSSNPISTSTNFDNMNFFPFFLVNDLTPIITIILTIVILLSISPNLLGDVENFNNASISTTPAHIQPEWYFLFAYAILRSIPSNLGGVVAMVSSILVLTVLCFNSHSLGNNFSPLSNALFWFFLAIFILLTWIGANPVEPPFVSVGQFLSFIYFLTSIFL